MASAFEKLAAFEARLRADCRASDDMDRPAVLEAARAVVPLDTLRERALAACGSAGDGDALIRQVLAWFKHEFFSWVNAPTCASCGGKTRSIGGAPPSADDLAGGAQRVELYSCRACGAHTRFPRYNDVRRLLHTRRGRCGEWANAFTCICRALGYRARYVHDYTDHVWTEVWSEGQTRWLHADPCENKLDAPLMYCTGWKKKLSYIFAFGPGEAVDVVNRYITADARPAALERRQMCSENWVRVRLDILDQERRGHLAAGDLPHRDNRRFAEAQELARPAERRNPSAAEAGGRETGSLEWRRQRGELGDGCDQAANMPASGEGPAHAHVWDTSLPAGGAQGGGGEWRLRYSAQRDAYYVNGGDAAPAIGEDPAVRGWRAGAAASDNARRAEEDDWNMVYLAREDGGKRALIEWQFRSPPRARIVSGTALLTHSLHAEGADVSWRLSRDNGVTWRKLKAPCDAPVDLRRALAATDARGTRSEAEHEDGCTLLRLRAELSGGTWQSAQLFRQTRTDLRGFPLDVRLRLSVVSDPTAAPLEAEPAPAAQGGAGMPSAPSPSSTDALRADRSARDESDVDAVKARFARVFAEVMEEGGAFANDPTGAAAEALRRMQT